MALVDLLSSKDYVSSTEDEETVTVKCDSTALPVSANADLMSDSSKVTNSILRNKNISKI